jgi:endonuclease YncB( thermonuclease family)
MLFVGFKDVQNVVVKRVYDGDTFFVDIVNYPDLVGKDIAVRIYGIDTAEMRGGTPEIKAKAKLAKEYLKMILRNAKNIELRNVKRGKYFRIVADVYADGNNVAEMMLKAGMAVRYYGGKKGEVK